MRFDELVSRFSARVDEADGVVVPCPAHRDSNPSMKITLKDNGQALVVCRAGCPQSRVMEGLGRLGVTAADLFDVDGAGARMVRSAAPETVGPAEVAGLRVFVDETAGALATSPKAIGYLERRFGLTLEQAQDLEIGYAPPGDRAQPWLSRGFTRHPRLTVPFSGFDGVVRGLQGRDLGGKCPARWMSLTNVPGKAWAKYSVMQPGSGFDTALVCEGPSDALTAVGAGYTAIAVRGAGLSRNAALVAELADGLRDMDVVLCGDRDRAGAGFTDSLAVALVKAGVMVRRLEIPHEGDDLTDWRERDPEAFPGQLHAAVRAAVVVELETPKPAPEPSTEPDIPATDAALQSMSQSAREMFDSTDVGLAVRLRDYMRRQGGGVRYAKGLGFLVWNGKIWVSGDATVREALHRMGAEMIAGGDDYERRLALKALTNRHIEGILKELPSVPGVPATANDFDRSPELLSVGNGTVNLRTGELKPHDPADLITRMVEPDYRPGALSPRWDRFLVEVFPNHPEMVDYIRRIVGYGITGSTAEQMFVFHHGAGANGKSVFLDVLTHVFRGVTKSAQVSVFEQRTAVGQANPELADLYGARLVFCSETERYSRLADALIKQITGGDPVTARRLHSNPFTFTPTFLLQIAGNYRPAIMSADFGTWRRVKLVSWEATFRGKNADPELPAKLKAEAEGVLAWAVRGAVEWYASGLQEPSAVQQDTADYRESEDRLQEWLEACLVQEPGARIAPMQLRRAYAEWCEDAGMSRKEQLSGWSLGVEVEARGFPKKKVGGRWGFQGIRLKTDAEKAAEQRQDDGPLTDGNSDIFGQQRGA
ncbi:phage/plasmid primase, P4 family [Streptomyces asiaticus]|uniref:phage/plasmid primase, P4 family n=1 Tax=Streptomyces asiaticus TaxID=114695 RepID=UPI001BA77EF3|nr:phage/plasmid primase, P4 family [Streptomyces asiaticus]